MTGEAGTSNITNAPAGALVDVATTEVEGGLGTAVGRIGGTAITVMTAATDPNFALAVQGAIRQSQTGTINAAEAAQLEAVTQQDEAAFRPQPAGQPAPTPDPAVGATITAIHNQAQRVVASGNVGVANIDLQADMTTAYQQLAANGVVSQQAAVQLAVDAAQ